MRVPKLIWMYWDGCEQPKIVKLCIKQCQFYNPSYKINVLNSSNLEQFVSKRIIDLSKILGLQQHKADLIRLAVLYSYGGIWLDASIIVRKSFDNFIKQGEIYDFVGFYTDYNTLPEFKNISPVVENWMFCSIKHCLFIHDWLNEFLRMFTFSSIDDYVDDLKNKGINPQGLYNSIGYHIVYFSAQSLLQTQREKYNIHLIKCDDTVYKLQVENSWKELISMKKLLDGECKDQPLTKLISCDRKILEDYGGYEKLFIFNRWYNQIFNCLI